MDLLPLLLLVSLALAPMVLAQPNPPAPPVSPAYRIEFDLTTETYDDLFRKLANLLRTTRYDPPYNPSEVFLKPVLSAPRPKFYGRPIYWILVVVKVGQQAETTLAIALDDLYILGFKNSAGDWYIMKGFAGLPNNITLSFGENYDQLIYGGHRMLYTVPLGNQSAVQAVRRLASYNPATTTDAQLTQALVRFVVMISEATRFRVIREVFTGRWEQVTFMTQNQAKLVTFWGKLSRLLVHWSNHYQWTGGVADEVKDKIGINGPHEAAPLLEFLVRPPAGFS